MTEEKIKEFTARISKANRSEMVVVIYDMAISYIDSGEAGMAIKCISSLIEGLDFEYEISYRLLELYTFANKELLKEKIDGNEEHFENAKKVLETMREAFSYVASQDSSPAMVDVTRHVEVGMTYGKGTLNESIVNPEGNHSFSI